jgi:hypothetical protein
MFFYEESKVPGSGFGIGLASLITALNTDFDWLREHTRYLQRAKEWDEGGRPANRLLSGGDIAEAKAWAARRPKSAPEPTALHLKFIRASEEEADARLSEQRKQLEAVAAAQAARETALQEAEEALKQAADAQRKRARIRNITVVLGILAAVATWFGWNAEWKRMTITRGLTDITSHLQAGVEKLRAAGALSDDARQALLAKEFPKALALAERAHALFPDGLVIEINRAHALMFMERGDEAKALYLAHKGKPVVEHFFKLWEAVIAGDFQELRQAGLTHPMMTDIEKELGTSPDGNSDIGKR